MERLKRILGWIVIALILLVGFLVLLIWFMNFYPARVTAADVVCEENAPVLQSGQTFKVMTYNVQYMAGKNYVFFYDLPGDSGPDERPSAEDITLTLAEVARVIREEDPDAILLQEVDDGSARTDKEDQLARLMELLPAEYACQTSTFYWKSAFVPHGRIMGAIGHKMSVVSKYQITASTRYQLPLAPSDLLTQQFSPKRAILEARMPVNGGPDFLLMTTHLEVANRGPEVKEAEIAQIDTHLVGLNQAGNPWVLGGDFNLLPPGGYELLPAEQTANYFRPNTELGPIFEKYAVIPGAAEVSGDGYEDWFTMFVNDPRTTAPDRTLDYIFYSGDLTLMDGVVRQGDTWTISDHLPVIAVFRLP